MKKYWQEIEGWIMANGPSVMNTLNAPATNEDLRILEHKLGALPGDFKDFLAVHNGQSWKSLKLFGSDYLLSTEDIIGEWQNWIDVMPMLDAQCLAYYGEPMKSSPAQGVKDHWSHPLWIPITTDGAGNSYCIDLDPDVGGKVGQIIRMWHDVPWRELIATSFKEWIETYVNDLQNGTYYFYENNGRGGVFKVED